MLIMKTLVSENDIARSTITKVEDRTASGEWSGDQKEVLEMLSYIEGVKEYSIELYDEQGLAVGENAFKGSWRARLSWEGAECCKKQMRS